MKIETIKNDLKNHLNHNVYIKVFGMRNKINEYYGKINGIYPNLFTIIDSEGEKSFSYRDIITGDIKIKFN